MMNVKFEKITIVFFFIFNLPCELVEPKEIRSLIWMSWMHSWIYSNEFKHPKRNEVSFFRFVCHSPLKQLLNSQFVTQTFLFHSISKLWEVESSTSVQTILIVDFKAVPLIFSEKVSKRFAFNQYEKGSITSSKRRRNTSIPAWNFHSLLQPLKEHSN